MKSLWFSPSLCSPAAIVLTLAVGVGASACSANFVSPGAAPAQSDPFVGTWNCAGASTTTYSLPPGASPTTVDNGSVLVITDDGTGNDTVVRMPSGQPTCTFQAELDATHASLVQMSEHTCTLTNGNIVTYQADAYTSDSGDSFSTETRFTVEGMNAAGAVLRGSGSGMSTCNRME